MAQIVPQTLIREVASGNDDVVKNYRPRVIITPEMLAENGSQTVALFEGIVTLYRFDNNGNKTGSYESHCRLSPMFSSMGTRLIAYQIEEGAEPGKLVLPEDVRPIPQKAAKS